MVRYHFFGVSWLKLNHEFKHPTKYKFLYAIIYADFGKQTKSNIPNMIFHQHTKIGTNDNTEFTVKSLFLINNI